MTQPTVCVLIIDDGEKNHHKGIAICVFVLSGLSGPVALELLTDIQLRPKKPPRPKLEMLHKMKEQAKFRTRGAGQMYSVSGR